MTQQEFLESLEVKSPTLPENLSPGLRVLWLSANDQWEAAHEEASAIDSPTGAWLHAYLHRVEGDLGNANYWYHRAQRPTPPRSLSLQSEWQNLLAHVMAEI